MKRCVFEGVATALPTPFDLDGGVDHAAFSALVERQLNCGVKTLVVASTTGEGSSLDISETQDLLSLTYSLSAHRGGKVVAAVCENDTARAINKARRLSALNISALLVITPFYNKTSDNGLIRHFFAVADASIKPVILYNVPSRTGMTISPPVYKKLARHPNIYGVKEAGASFENFFLSRSEAPRDFRFYSGCDETFIPFCLSGGDGVISVLSNVCPRAVVSAWQDVKRGDKPSLYRLQKAFYPLISSLFCQVNPIPLKFALSRLGLINNVLRAPLCTLDKRFQPRVIRAINAVGEYI